MKEGSQSKSQTQVGGSIQLVARISERSKMVTSEHSVRQKSP